MLVTKQLQTTELQLQAAIFQYHWNNYPNERGQLFHVNQKARNAIEGNKMKALGVVAGVSDLILLRPGGIAIFLELKTDTGKQSNAQAAFQATVESLGFRYAILTSLPQFKELLLNCKLWRDK